MRVKAKITVKNVVCEESSATAHVVFYCECEFDVDLFEWICSEALLVHFSLAMYPDPLAPTISWERVALDLGNHESGLGSGAKW